MTVPKALEIKEELETIDRLLKQLEEAAKTAQIGIIDLEALAEFAEPGDIEQLNATGRADRRSTSATWPSGRAWSKPAQGYQLTPKAYRLFQGRLLERIFSDLQASRTGRHQGPIVGEGAVELPADQALRVRRFAGQHGHPRLADQRHDPRRAGPADPPEARRHRGPSHPQHAQVRHRGAAGHERLDALRRAVHQRQADGPGPGRADPPRISRRLPAIHRDVHLRQAAAARRDRRAAAQAGDDLRPGGAAARRHERRADQRSAHSRRTSPTSSTACSWRGSCWPPRTRPTGRSS